ncbi:MAG: hypothetical protein SGI88_09095 [Candidatus Hydrogenedentes bacterium]|nr:hypothetical protein [Candidatus Hydrogenedentota bacterium]
MRILPIVKTIIALSAVLGTACMASPTFINPQDGPYSFDQLGQFTVDVSKNGEVIIFSVDGFRFDEIPVVNGAFFNQWGDLNGTHCPTDAYILSGHFVSPTRAKGDIRYGSGCNFGTAQNFVAELQAD